MTASQPMARRFRTLPSGLRNRELDVSQRRGARPNPPWVSNHQSSGWHVKVHKCSGRDHRSISDRDPAHHNGVLTHPHAFLQAGCSNAVSGLYLANRNTFVDVAVRPDFGLVRDDDSSEIPNVEAWCNPRRDGNGDAILRGGSLEKQGPDRPAGRATACPLRNAEPDEIPKASIV
jgi:hypothetical protein